MLYSRWVPDKGGYVYYETPERRGLGDDLPTPRMRRHSDLGVASTEVGRALPLGAKIVGTGPVARGCIVPMDRSFLSGVSSAERDLPMAALYGALALASAFAGAWIAGKIRD